MKEYVIQITPDFELNIEELDPKNVLGDLQSLCGGYIQTVLARFQDRSLVLVLDEEGKLKDKPVNVIATWLTDFRMDKIAGHAVLCREGLRDGEPDLVGFGREEAAGLAQDIVESFLGKLKKAR